MNSTSRSSGRVRLLAIGLIFFLTHQTDLVPIVCASEQLTVAHAALNLLTTPVWMAREKGFFSRRGLEVETIYIPSGTLAMQALLGGDIKIAVADGSSVVNASLRGASVKIIAGMVNYYPNAFFSAPDIKDPRDLRGKKIAVTRVGSSSYTATVMALRKLGLGEGKDYTILQLGSTQNRLAALTKGMIQGTTLSAPESVVARNAGMKVLISASDMKKLGVMIQHQALDVTEKSIRESRPLLKAFLMGYLEGVREVYRNKEATVQVLSKYTRISDLQVLSASYDESYEAIDKEGTLVEGAIEVILTELGKTDPRARKAHSSQFFDPSLLQEISREGFIKALWSESK
jgi:NitT/TauT family transport system substrate-binding protein